MEYKDIICFFENAYICDFIVKSNFAAIGGLYKDLRDEFIEDLDKCNSPIEKIMFCILKNIEISDVKPQQKIGKYVVDFLCFESDRKIVIECDGHEFHEKTKEQAQKDKERDRFLQINGYEVYRFTGSEIFNNPMKVYFEIEKILFDREG